MQLIMRASSNLLAAAVLAVLGAQGLQAQQQVDSRWLPWIGCWEIVAQDETAEMQIVCVEPSDESSSAVQLLSEARNVENEVLNADGQARPVQIADCEGSERSVFSQDGSRVYVTGEYSCADGATQLGRGVIAMVSPDEWVDIRSLTQDGETVVMAQVYRAASAEDIAEAGRVELASPRTELSRRLASAAPDTDDVVDVYRAMGAEGTQAWLMSMGQRLDLDADALIALADAGVEPEVIDMAIAVSYPDDFQLADQANSAVASVERAPREAAASRRWYSPYGRRYRMTYGFWGPMYSPLGYLFTPYSYLWGNAYWWDVMGGGWGCRFCRGFNSWGWGAFGPGWGGGGFGGGGFGFGGPIVVRAGGGDGDRGRSVAGQGFTRSNPSTATGRSRTAPRSRDGAYGSRGVRGNATPRAGVTRSAGARGGVQAAPPSSSTGGKSTGRRAKPRGGGGGV